MEKLGKIIFFIIFVSACGPTNLTFQRIPFPLSEYEALNDKGTGIVKGQVFLKTRGGEVKTAAGNKIILNQVTSYSNQWYEEVYLKRNNLTEKD